MMTNSTTEILVVFDPSCRSIPLMLRDIGVKRRLCTEPIVRSVATFTIVKSRSPRYGRFQGDKPSSHQ